VVVVEVEGRRVTGVSASCPRRPPCFSAAIMPRDPTNAQLSAKLSYQSGQTPSFLLKLQRQVAGHAPADEDEPTYIDEEFEHGHGGRPDIPRRPPIPRRPDDEAGSGDEKPDGTGELDEEDGDEERPQIVVLREGKHLSELEVDNEKRKGASLHLRS
jgi:hypothetical protein